MHNLRNHAAKWPLATCLVLLVAAPLLCLLLNPYPDIILRDQWRMLPLATSYYLGTLKAVDVIAPHWNVSIVLYKAIFILNAIFFKSNMTMEFGLGVLFMFAYSAMFFYAIHKDVEDKRILPVVFLPVLLMIYSQWQFLLWHFSLLVVLFGALLFFAAIAIVFLDKFLSTGGKPSHAVLSLLSLGFLIVGETTASFIVLFALLGLLGLKWLLNPELRVKLLRYATGALLLCLLAGGLQHLYTRILWPSQDTVVFWGIFAKLGERAVYTLVLFGSSLCIPNIGADWLPFVGGGVILLYLVAILASLYTKNDRGSSLPVFLILCSFAFALVLLIGRSGTPAGPAIAPRYVHGMRIGLAGLVWIVGTQILRLRPGLLRVGLLAAGLCFVLALEGLAVVRAINYNASYYVTLEHQRDALRTQAYDEIKPVIINPNMGTEYLRRMDMELRRLGLSMYRNDPPAQAPSSGDAPGGQ